MTEPVWMTLMREQVDEFRALLREVAISAVAFDDERIDYVVVQIPRVVWDAIRNKITPEIPSFDEECES